MRGRPPEPKSPQEWQTCVDAAHALLVLDSARLYGLVAGGPKINVNRAEYLLEKGRRRGFSPDPNAVKKLVREING